DREAEARRKGLVARFLGGERDVEDRLGLLELGGIAAGLLGLRHVDARGGGDGEDHRELLVHVVARGRLEDDVRLGLGGDGRAGGRLDVDDVSLPFRVELARGGLGLRVRRPDRRDGSDRSDDGDEPGGGEDGTGESELSHRLRGSTRAPTLQRGPLIGSRRCTALSSWDGTISSTALPSGAWLRSSAPRPSTPTGTPTWWR